MNSFYLGLGLFFLYSFLGWLAEVAFSAVSRKKFINTGFHTGPICPIYGVGILFILHFLEPLRDNLFFLFVGSTVVATVLEYVTNRLLEGLTRYQVVGLQPVPVPLWRICLPGLFRLLGRGGCGHRPLGQSAGGAPAQSDPCNHWQGDPAGAGDLAGSGPDRHRRQPYCGCATSLSTMARSPQHSSRLPACPASSARPFSDASSAAWSAQYPSFPSMRRLPRLSGTARRPPAMFLPMAAASIN